MCPRNEKRYTRLSAYTLTASVFLLPALPIGNYFSGDAIFFVMVSLVSYLWWHHSHSRCLKYSHSRHLPDRRRSGPWHNGQDIAGLVPPIKSPP